MGKLGTDKFPPPFEGEGPLSGIREGGIASRPRHAITPAWQMSAPAISEATRPMRRQSSGRACAAIPSKATGSDGSIPSAIALLISYAWKNVSSLRQTAGSIRNKRRQMQSARRFLKAAATELFAFGTMKSFKTSTAYVNRYCLNSQRNDCANPLPPGGGGLGRGGLRRSSDRAPTKTPHRRFHPLPARLGSPTSPLKGEVIAHDSHYLFERFAEAIRRRM